MFKKVVQRGRSERGGEAYRGPVALSTATGERYVEPLSDARTKLEAFFNILLGSEFMEGAVQPLHLLFEPVYCLIHFFPGFGFDGSLEFG